MAVVMNQDFAGVSREDVEELTKSMRVRESPPAGLVAHAATDTSEGIHVVDIWESEADFQTFLEERLMPAAKAFAQEHGIDMEGFGQPMFTEAYDVVVGRQA
jgi:heme-degrading monooxygenase HmoA